MRRRGPRPLTGALTALADELAPPTTLAGAQRVWPAVAGELLAREARPVSERSGVLTVSCSSSLWAHELELMSALVRERLNDALGGGERIRRLRCVATPPRD